MTDGKKKIPPQFKDTVFKPGETGNPGGRPKVPEDIKEARKLNKIEISRIINKYMNMAIEDIKSDMNKPGTKALEAMIGKIISEAHKHGDYSRVNFLFDRMVGKVTEKVEMKLPKPTMVKLLDGSAILLGNKKNEDDDDESDS